MENIATKIIIANPSPFRLIIRDENDKWEMELEDVNQSSYNYVKLHRSTKAFDANIVKPFPLVVGFDGSYILPACKEYQNLDAVLDEFNRIFAAIFIGGVYIEAIDISNLAFGEINETGYFRHKQVFGQNPRFHMNLGLNDASSYERMRLLNAEKINWKDIETAYKLGNNIFTQINNLSPFLFLTCFTYFLKHQVRESLTHAWLSIEQIINNIWDSEYVESAKNINIPKRRQFLESQQWSIAHKVEVLYQNRLINEELYTLLNEGRITRNKLMHQGISPNKNSAKTVLLALVELLELICADRDIKFKKENLTKYLIDSGVSIVSGEIVATAEEVDWSNVTVYSIVLPIPGEKGWEGDFESFDDIKLKKIN